MFSYYQEVYKSHWIRAYNSDNRKQPTDEEPPTQIATFIGDRYVVLSFK